MTIFSIIRKADGQVGPRTHDITEARAIMKMAERRHPGVYELVIADDSEPPFYPPEAPSAGELAAAYEATIDADFDLYEESRDHD